MYLFSYHIKTHKIEPITLLNLKNRKYHIYAWLAEVAGHVKSAQELYPNCYKSLSEGLIKWINPLIEDEWINNTINQKILKLDMVITNLYQTLLQYAKLNSKKNPITPLQPYLYSAKHSGVSINACLIRKTKSSNAPVFELSLSACDSLQAGKENRSKMREEILLALKTSFLSNQSKQLIIASINAFHAEHFWFSVQLNKLIAYVMSNKSSFAVYKKTKDEFILNQFSEYPRLEFVITSSPCMDCQLLFVDLRNILNYLEIDISIVIFANSPFNTAEVTESPIAIVKKDHTYVVTGIAGKLPYYLTNQQRFIRQKIELVLFNKDEQTFLELENIMNTYMPRFYAAPLIIKAAFIKHIWEAFYFECQTNWNTEVWSRWYFAERFDKEFLPDWKGDINSPEESNALLEFFESGDGLMTAQERVNRFLISEMEYLLYGVSDISPDRIAYFLPVPISNPNHIRICQLEILEWYKENRKLTADESSEYQRLLSDNLNNSKAQHEISVTIKPTGPGSTSTSSSTLTSYKLYSMLKVSDNSQPSPSASNKAKL